MLSRLIFACALAAAGLLNASLAQAERRVALVVGNAQYVQAPTLRNPRNDANDMAETLRRLGFEVVLGLDLDQRGFAQKIDEFARRLDDAEVALFYYAGHGLQLNDKNYLVSTDAQLSSEFLVSSETIELDQIVRLMEQKAPLNLVLLDACRNNPLADGLRKSLTALKRGAALGRGLARVEPQGRDTLVAFAAAPGQEAADGGDERNSPFTAALLRHIGRPGQEVSVMLKEVAAEVRRDTRNAQRPQQVSDMTRTFYFAKGTQVAAADTSGRPEPPRGQSRPEPASPQAAGPSAEQRALDLAFWNSAQAANDCEAVKAYLVRFPNGLFVDLARITERRLCAPRTAAAEPVPAPPASAMTPPAVAPVIPPQMAAPTPPAPAPQAATSPDPAGAVQSAPRPPPAPAPVAAPAPAPAPAPAAAPAPAPVSAPATPANPEPELIRTIQIELVRVGCGTLATDGAWNPATQQAVLRFNQHGRWRFDPAVPSPALLAALRRNDARVCPLECEPGYEAQGNTCVAAAPPPAPAPQKKKAERSKQKQKQKQKQQKQAQPRQEQRRAQSGARQAAPVPNPGSTRGGRTNCRFVPRATGGGYQGDTIEVCN
jgi:uncharacterized caspase-like protein